MSVNTLKSAVHTYCELHEQHAAVSAVFKDEKAKVVARIAVQCKGMKWEKARTTLVPYICSFYKCEATISESPRTKGQLTIAHEGARKALWRLLKLELLLTAPAKAVQQKAAPMPDVFVAQMVRIASRCTKAQWIEVQKTLRFATTK